MARDDGLIDLDELRELLRAHEGPPKPRQRSESSAGQGRKRTARHMRWAGLVAVVALLLGSGLGFGIGSSITPRGGAAQVPAGLGFLPERGWTVLRSRTEPTPEWPSFAVASNVPLESEDVAAPDPPYSSGHPHATIESLPDRGVVLVASFAVRGVHEASDAVFPPRRLPLRLRDAPIGPSSSRYRSYELYAAVNGYNVTITVYFGDSRPSRALVTAAQRQLDRLVVGVPDDDAAAVERATPLRADGDLASAESRVVARTFLCTPIAYGSDGDLDISVTPTRIDRAQRRVVAALDVGTSASQAESSLVLVRSASQPWLPGLAVPFAVGGRAGVYAHRRRCIPTQIKVPLSAKGLPGPPTRWEKDLDCSVRGRVIVRVRSSLRAAARWRRADRWYYGASKAVERAEVGVWTETTRRPIAYMELDEGGRTRVWYAAACG